MIKAVCFDLDGTLLPLDIDVFCKQYFSMLAAKMAPHGYEPKAFIGAILSGTKEMYQNDGKRTNEQVFWDHFCSVFGERARADEPIFAEFYETEFDRARAACGFDADAAPSVKKIQQMGLRVAIATNPFFPRIATYKRLSWAGIPPETVEFFTTYEDAHFSKPNPDYYREVAARLGLAPEECLMVGNDVGEDMVAAKVGMQVFLLTNDYLINKKDEDISTYPHGGFAELLAHIANLQK